MQASSSDHTAGIFTNKQSVVGLVGAYSRYSLQRIIYWDRS